MGIHGGSMLGVLKWGIHGDPQFFAGFRCKSDQWMAQQQRPESATSYRPVPQRPHATWRNPNRPPHERIGQLMGIHHMIYVVIPVVPHKAVAEVSKIGNLQERLVVVNQGWQSEATDGLKSAWGLLSFSLFLSFSLCFSIFLWLSTYLPIDLSVYLSVCLSISLSIYLPIYLAV